GRPALAVQWGVISDAGYVAQHPDVAEYLGRQGYGSFSAEAALAALGDLLQRDAVDAVVARVDWRRLADYSPGTVASPSFRDFAPAAAASQASGGSIAATIARIGDPAERLVA